MKSLLLGQVHGDRKYIGDYQGPRRRGVESYSLVTQILFGMMKKIRNSGNSYTL